MIAVSWPRRSAIMVMKYARAIPAAGHVARRLKTGMPATLVDHTNGLTCPAPGPNVGARPSASRNRANLDPGVYQSTRASSFQLPVPATKIGCTLLQLTA